MRVLMCSPVKGTGGISRWTNALLNFYQNHSESNIILHNYYPTKGKQSLATTPILTRIKNAWANYYPFLAGLKRQIKEFNPDVIHLVSSASLALLRDYIAIKICKRYGKKTIIHFRFGRIPDLFILKNWEFKLLTKIIKMVDYTLVLDNKSFSTLVKNGYKNVKLLPNPLSEQVNNLINKTSAWEPGNKTILFVGHVLPSKGIQELIIACRQIKNINLRILGLIPDGYDRELKKIAGDYWNKIEFLGNQTIETVIDEMSHCGIFVLPTYTEGFPNVIIEAMGVGCPIITTPVGAIPEMLQISEPNPCGICVPVMEVEALKEAIIKLSSDTNLCLQFSRSAKERANSVYSMSSIWKQLCDTWKALVN